MGRLNLIDPTCRPVDDFVDAVTLTRQIYQAGSGPEFRRILVSAKVDVVGRKNSMSSVDSRCRGWNSMWSADFEVGGGNSMSFSRNSMSSGKLEVVGEIRCRRKNPVCAIYQVTVIWSANLS